MAIARKKMARRKKHRPKIVKHRVTIYQIQVKGPERNKAFSKLFESIKNSLKEGKVLTKADRYGNVIRALTAWEETKPRSLVVSLVKFNSKKTGLAWDTSKNELVEELNKVTAQQTKLVIIPEHHVALHIHDTHGPTPSQLEFYLKSILNSVAEKIELDCSIDILPLKVQGAVKDLERWRSIKKFIIEVIRPNPSGSVKSRTLKNILDKSDSDKAILELKAKTAKGIKKSGIRELINEGDRLIQLGQARVFAEGSNEDAEPDSIDSEKVKVRYFDIKTDTDDLRSLPELLFDSLRKWLIGR